MNRNLGRAATVAWRGLRSMSAILAGAFLLSFALPSFAVTRYFKERTFSAVTIAVADNIRAIASKGASKGKHSARFMKVGDSITASDSGESLTQPNSYYLSQFGCPDWTSSSAAWDYTRRLDTYKTALTPALLYFLNDSFADKTTSFNHYSVTARVGWAADQAVSGNPCPLRNEINRITPQFAVIMYGANDAGGYGSFYSLLSGYMTSMHKIVDTCLAEGIVPVLMSTCPNASKMDISCTMSHLIRCLAQQHQTPFIDYHRAMMPLPSHGLGSDGVHPNSLDYNQMCWFTPQGLQYGYNLRNLLTLQALDGMYRVAVKNVESLDPDPPPLTGAGTQGDPYIIDSISFVDAQTTSAATPDVYYKLATGGPLKIRAMVTFQGNANFGISLLNDGRGVIASGADEAIIEQSLAAGTYSIKVQTRGEGYGDYQFVLTDRDDDGSPKGPHPEGIQTAICQDPGRQSFGVVTKGHTITVSANSGSSVTFINSQGKIFSTNMATNHGFVQWQAPSAGAYFIRVKHSGTSPQMRTVVVR
jgi:hypothetical protein